jgi:hypothetical protein
LPSAGPCRAAAPFPLCLITGTRSRSPLLLTCGPLTARVTPTSRQNGRSFPLCTAWKSHPQISFPSRFDMISHAALLYTASHTPFILQFHPNSPNRARHSLPKP